MKSLALDIGGANIKAAHGDGETASVAFALWKEPGRLREELESVARRFSSFDRVLVTMTAELCDCFETKRQGVNHVLHAVAAMAGDRLVGVWTTDGEFAAVEQARREPLKAAASNWHALATFVASLFPDGLSLLIDTGSTTTDIIRLRDGRPDATGMTDMARLASGELVYIGVERTSLAALGPTIELGEKIYGVMAELFATTADVFLISGELRDQPERTDTADGRPMTRACAMARIVRMIGADLEMVSEADAIELASAFAAKATERIGAAVRRVAGENLIKNADPHPGPLPKKGEGGRLSPVHDQVA